MIEYKNCDIVYILKEGINSEELKQSLRSVEALFPHRKIWFVGGQPKDLKPDAALPHKQSGLTKWSRVKSSFRQIMDSDEISENFFLFNDDFFVLKRPRFEFINFAYGTLDKRIKDLENNLSNPSSYSVSLRKLNNKLKEKNYDTINFALHLPMLLNKEMVKKTFTVFPGNTMFRSAYGNINEIPYMYHKDVKIYDNFSTPERDWDFVSTTEESFKKGEVGKYIRNIFDKPSKYEINKPKEETKELYTEEGEDRYC